MSSDNAKTDAKLHHKIDHVNAPSNKNRAGVFKASYEFNTIILKAGCLYKFNISLFSPFRVSSDNAKTDATLHHKIDRVNAPSNKNRAWSF